MRGRGGAAKALDDAALAVDDHALRDEHERLRRLARAEALEDPHEAVHRIAGALVGIRGDEAGLFHHHVPAHLRFGRARPVGRNHAALAHQDFFHCKVVAPLERERVGDADVLHSLLRVSLPVDLPQRGRDRPVIGGEVDQRSLWNREQRDAVGGVEAIDESSRGRQHVARADRRDAAAIDRDCDGRPDCTVFVLKSGSEDAASGAVAAVADSPRTATNCAEAIFRGWPSTVRTNRCGRGPGPACRAVHDRDVDGHDVDDGGEDGPLRGGRLLLSLAGALERGSLSARQAEQCCGNRKSPCAHGAASIDPGAGFTYRGRRRGRTPEPSPLRRCRSPRRRPAPPARPRSR